MKRPLPAPFQNADALFARAHHFSYAYYTATPLRVDEQGEVKEASAEAKQSFMEAALKTWQQSKDVVKPFVEAAAARMEAQKEALAAQGFEVRVAEHATATRLLAGLGYKNGAEVGLTLHPVYGVPYLPGSSVKGVVRAWAEQQAAAGEVDRETLARIFGSADKLKEGDEGEHRLGAVRFFDALPAAWPRLELDVLTPHFGPYYQKPAATPPAVWHDPIPVSFLTVAAGTPFRFLLAAQPGTHGAEPGDLKRVEGWLSEALAWLGAGGKTGAGYGRFATDALDALFG